MTKIVDLINFHTAYGDQVRLLDYFYNENENLEHMSGYVPIRSHRKAILDLARAQLPDKENKDKVFMLTGSIGTGKSHLCLMLANYFSLKPTDLEMQKFFTNWSTRDPKGAGNIRNWRGDGRYLVALCDFGEAKSFEEMVITAIETALEHEGAKEIILNTHYKSALRQIEGWKQRQKSGEPIGVFEDFLNYLGGDDPQQELDDLAANLAQNAPSAMVLFQETYQKATGQKLSFKIDSLLAILKDLLSNPAFQKRYKGLVILADEFGYALSDNRVSLGVFQGFAEMSKDGVAGMQLIFIGTGHRRFAAYGANSQLQIDFRVVQDRVTEVSLESEELEQIIGALVSPRTDKSEWKKDVIGKNRWLFTQMASGAKKFGIFDYLDGPEVFDHIVKNIYPMHPMATYCLTKMSQELGSDARSVFAFFRKFEDSPPLGGYSWYVRNHEVTRPDGELNIYYPNLLTAYFKPSFDTTVLTVRPEVRDRIRNYLAAIEEAERYAFKNSISKEIDQFTLSVMDMILVYRVCNINVTLESIAYGLNLHRQKEKKILSSVLKTLIRNRIIFQSPSGEYEFRRSDMADLDTMVNEIKHEILEHSFDLVFQVTDLANNKWTPWTEAKGHNQDYLGDKRVRRLFATPQVLSAKYKLVDGSEVTFWKFHEIRRKGQKSWRDKYDGIMVYVLCENEEDTKLAQQGAKSNEFETIIVGIPRTPIPIKDAVINLLAVKMFKETEQYNSLDFQEKALVEEMLGKENQKTGLVGELLLVRERYLDARDLYWYREDGKTHLAESTNEYEPADLLMNRLFDQRNTISHDYLSKSHPKSFTGVKDKALQEAVGILINLDKPVQIDLSEKQNRGEIRYLKIALADEGVLLQEGDYEGNIAKYELESNPEKYQFKYPGLADLIEELKSIKRGESTNIWEILSNMTKPPYGLGPYSLAIFTACTFRNFGDELRLKINPTTPGYSATNDPEIIIDVATGKFPGATIERRLINPATETLINEIYNLFTETPAAAGTQQTLSESWRSLLWWWKNRTRLERAVGIYTDDSTGISLVDMLSRLSEDTAGSQIFLEEIKQIYGYSPDAELEEENAVEILTELKSDKEMIETRAESIKSTLVKNISVLFNPQGDTYKDYANAIHNWYTNLHSDQKALHAEWQSPTSRTLLEAVPKLQDLEVLLLEIVPSAPGFNFGKVDDWSYNQTDSYINLFNDAKLKVETSLPKVPAPIWNSSVEPEMGFQGVPTIKFHGSVILNIDVPKEGDVVRVTVNEDPRYSKQFTTIKMNKSWQTVITESCSYQMATLNSQGDFSKVVRVTYTNLDEAYKLISETAPKLDPVDREYRFRNPVNKHSLIVLLVDIINHLKNDRRIPMNDIAAAFKEAASETQLRKPKEKKK